MWMNKIKQNKKVKPHIQIDHAFCCLIQPTNNTIKSLKDGFMIWRQTQKEAPWPRTSDIMSFLS